MPDITMCMSRGCPKKNECYRHTAKPDKLQGYKNYEMDCLVNDYEFFWKDERQTENKNT